MVVQSKSLLASKWNLIDEEWATKLVGLRMKVRGLFWNGCTNKEKRTFYVYGGIIKSYNHNIRRWLIQFDNDDDEDQFMQYDAVLKFADEDAGTFGTFRLPLPATPVSPPEEQAVHQNKTFVMADKLDWTEIFKDTNHPEIPDMTFIPFTGKREEFDVDITEEEINNHRTETESLTMQRHRFNTRKRKYAWLEYHSRCTV